MKFLNLLKKGYYKILKIKSRLLYGKPVLVIMYHRVSNVSGDKLNHLTVSMQNFENQLCYFKEKYQILKLDEEWTSLKKTGIVITFDDGYADNIINALPLLEKFQIPATIFVTTLNINTKKEFWWDRLVFDYANCDELFHLPDLKDKLSKSNSVYKNISNLVHNLSMEEKEKWFLTFEKINNISFSPREDYRSLSNSELKLLSEHPLITFGIHTHHHYALGDLTYTEQKEELVLSLAQLTKRGVNFINYLAVPFGSYNKDTLILADELGVKGILLANDYYSSVKNKASKKIYRILMPDIEREKVKERLKNFDFQ